MKREYDTGTSEGVTFFIGTEIEKTPAFGKRTLFVVGLHDSQIITSLAKNNDCDHIYFGANQSFPKLAWDDAKNWADWEDMISECIDSGFLCTLDFDVSQVEGIVEGRLVEYRNFIPQISVKLPYLQQLGYNATIKIDDINFNATNHGVWCHSLHTLTSRETFTSWNEYSKDEIIK
jgi:hypothetical protein